MTGRWWRVATRRWRQSLQQRVIVSTLLVTTLVVVFVGIVVFRRVSGGVLDSQRRAAIAETRSNLVYARSLLADLRSDARPDDVQARLSQTAELLAGRASPPGTSIVLLGVSTPAIVTGSDRRLPGGGSEQLRRLPEAISPELRRSVGGLSQLAYSYVTLDRGAAREPVLVVGAPVDTATGRYELYSVFPLGPEMSTLSLVRQTLLAGGAILAVLVVGVAALVARQVVSPVRLAAQVAERFAAGQLSSRMAVHGEDELARLGEAFNEMAASLQAKIDQLEGLSRLQQRFVSDVSHELRTPLTTVQMAADVLHAARADFPPEVARSAELLTGELDRFESLLVDLLEISRFDSGAAVLDAEVVDVAALVRRVVDGLTPLAARRGTEVTVRTTAADLLVEADPRRIERVLRNLLANAIEYGEGLPVEVTLGADEHAVAVVVRDHGVGLRPGDASRVFGRFWRADPSRARGTGGTGLGLSIALEDVRLHGGWLQAWGEPGRGAAFRVTVPRHVGGEVRSSPVPLEPAAAASGR